jgi:phage shock protein A
MLERMHEKVAQEESLAEAYGEIANDSTTIEDEIDKAADVSSSKADDQLEALKKKIEKEHN